MPPVHHRRPPISGPHADDPAAREHLGPFAKTRFEEESVMIAGRTCDPFDQAMKPALACSARTFFGEVTISERWSCVLEKGIGKRPFDPVHDQGRQRRIAIKLAITPLQGNFAVEQDVMDSGRVWQRYTLPSLRAHQLDLHTLRGCYVQVCRVLTGETYVN